MTASFEHHSPGTSEQDWSLAGLGALPAARPAWERLVVLAAHPDDETLGAGGVLAASSRANADIVIIIATDGEGSHPASPTRTPTELAGIRRQECRAALRQLAPHADVHHLGLPDGRLASHAAELDAALSTLLGASGTRLLSPWIGDRHPDHEACAAAAARLAAASPLVEHWQYPIWFWHWAEPTEAALPANMTRVDLEAIDRAAKRRALAEYLSQHEPLSDEPGDEAILPAGMLAHFDRPFECFITPAAPATRPGYFDTLYAGSPDPWDLADRFYEQRKRDLIIAALPRRRFRRAFEPGCATGLLTVRLLERADEVVAWDSAAAALEHAATRLSDVPSERVQLTRGHIPAEWPDGLFDLIVLSEVGYYCADLHLLTGQLCSSLTDDGVVIACHWSHPAPDHPRTAGEVHEAIGEHLNHTVRHAEADFRLDVWDRHGISVAAAEGIV